MTEDEMLDFELLTDRLNKLILYYVNHNDSRYREVISQVMVWLMVNNNQADNQLDEFEKTLKENNIFTNIIFSNPDDFGSTQDLINAMRDLIKEIDEAATYRVQIRH